MLTLPDGIRYWPGYFNREQQEKLVEAIRALASCAPFYVATMPKTGKPMSVQMTNCGTLGWVSDQKGGYRYQPHHPVTGKAWPDMPAILIDLWQAVAFYEKLPEACLINYYADTARMGLHQDKDEQDFHAPVVSVSLGNDCLFRIGGSARQDPTRSMRLSSGDVIVLGGEGRLCFHGVDRIYPATSSLLKNGGRINLTLRRVSL